VVTPEQSTSLTVHATTAQTPPGWYKATAIAESPSGSDMLDFYVNVLPAAWPADGPAPLCQNTKELIELSAFDGYAWKRGNLSDTNLSIGIVFRKRLRDRGLKLTITDPGDVTPRPRTTSRITFKNSNRWPMAMRTSNSRACGASSQQVMVGRNMSATLTITSADTSTLVFAQSECRAEVDLFDCWSGSALGMGDIAQFTEGPFWTLFGGRDVLIETIGNWGGPDVADVIGGP
jgi:hypothetical protein